MTITANKTFGLDTVVGKLRAREPFAFSRWGDGEWSAILGHGHHNCDGQAYTPALRRELTEVLEAKPSYQLGIQALALRRFGSEIERWLAERELEFDWVNAGIFHAASIRDGLGPLTEALDARRVILVGPERLGCLPFLNPHHVVIPASNAYEALGETHALTVQALDRLGTDCVVAVSAGMGSKVLIHLLAESYLRATVLDFGSVWEPYAGVANRRYHKAILERLAAC